MIYIAKDDGALPMLLIKAKNKVDAKKAYGYYKRMVTDVLKKDIFINSPMDYFEDPDMGLVDLG